MNDDARRILVTAAEAAIAGLVTVYVMQPARLRVLRAQIVHGTFTALYRVSERVGRAGLDLETFYHQTNERQ